MRFLLPACLLLFSLPAFGSVVFDNGAPDLLSGTPSDNDYPILAGNLFSLTDATTLHDVHWWGFYSPGNTPENDAFTIDFYNAPSGTPALTRLASYPVSTSRAGDGTQVPPGYDVYRYSAIIPSTLLGPGTYLISIVNDTGSDADDDWYWATASQSGGNGFTRPDFESSWDPTGSGNAFYLTDDGNGSAIPEPSTALLAVLGLGALTLRLSPRRRH